MMNISEFEAQRLEGDTTLIPEEGSKSSHCHLLVVRNYMICSPEMVVRNFASDLTFPQSSPLIPKLGLPASG
jgi:hypothetical protein